MFLNNVDIFTMPIRLSFFIFKNEILAYKPFVITYETHSQWIDNFSILKYIFLSNRTYFSVTEYCRM